MPVALKRRSKRLVPPAGPSVHSVPLSGFSRRFLIEARLFAPRGKLCKSLRPESIEVKRGLPACSSQVIQLVGEKNVGVRAMAGASGASSNVSRDDEDHHHLRSPLRGRNDEDGPASV